MRASEFLPFVRPSDWVRIRDGDPRLRAMYERHYSSHRYRDGRRVKKTVGPGEYLALITQDGTAVAAWRKFRSRDLAHGQGVNLMLFRNEAGLHLSSYLIQASDELAWERWPNERLYTYVNAAKVRSRNPGYCFQCAGWTRCGTTIGGLLVFERLRSPLERCL